MSGDLRHKGMKIVLSCIYCTLNDLMVACLTDYRMTTVTRR